MARATLAGSCSTSGLAWRCRKIEQSNFFVAFIMTVILLAEGVLVGVNTYETDSRGQQLLDGNVIRTLAGIETAILVIFWFELVLKLWATGYSRGASFSSDGACARVPPPARCSSCIAFVVFCNTMTRSSHVCFV